MARELPGQGSLLAATGRTWFKPGSDVEYVGIHWLLTDSGRYCCRYPPGLPVLIAVAIHALGFEASMLINPVLASLALLGVFMLVRQVLPWAWAILAVAVLAINPVFNQHALLLISHMAVACCLVRGICLLVYWSREGKLWAIFLAGLVLGFIPTIRYPEAVFAFGPVVFIFWHWKERRKAWLHFLAAVAGVAIPLVPLLVRNHAAFGAFYRTGYALTNEQTGFGWEYFRSNFDTYVRGLNGGGLGLFFALGLLGLVLMCCWRRTRRLGALLILLILPVTLVYMAYYWGGGRNASGNLRFLMPTFACYAIGGVWALHQLSRGLPKTARGVLVALVLFVQFALTSLDPLRGWNRFALEKRVIVAVTRELQKHASKDDVILTTRQLAQHLDAVRRWRLADPMIVRPAGARRFRDMRRGRNNDDGAPSPRQPEKEETRLAKYAGLGQFERERKIARDITEWASGHRVFAVVPRSELERLRGVCFNRRYFKVLATVKPPPVPLPQRNRRGPFPRRGPPPGPPGMMGPGARGPFNRQGPGPPFGPGLIHPRERAFAEEILIAMWTYPREESNVDIPGKRSGP